MEDKITVLIESVYDKGYAVREDFFDIKESQELLSSLQKSETQMKNAGIGKEKDYTHVKEIRSDKIRWLDKGENASIDKLFFDTMEYIKLALNRKCFLGLNTVEFHFAKYEPGTFYKRHKDIFNSDDARKMSLIVYLNPNWKEGDGGELKIYDEENEITVQPKAGTLVLFESHIEHEVMMSYSNRYSITGWLKSEKFVL
ncbi:MAG: 2OG-Fe(II) oxygenase [Bacteroidia bacterium]